MQEIKAQGWRELGGNLSTVDHRLTLNNDAATSVVTLRDTKPSGTPITGDEGIHGAKIWYRLSIFGRPSTTVWEELSRVLKACSKILRRLRGRGMLWTCAKEFWA